MCCILLCPDFHTYAAEENSVFYLKKQNERQSRSLNNDSRMPVSSERYDVFGYTSQGEPDPHCPNLGMGIKYLAEDGRNPDGKGKRRYVYCIDHTKKTPENGMEMDFVGWADKKIIFAMYHGAMYYGEPARNSWYSTGDWRMDYFVTQTAIHILNQEFDMEDARRGMDRGNASEEMKNTALTYIWRMVHDAGVDEYYQFFTPNGWIDMDKAEFTLESGKDVWYEQEGTYRSDGVFHPELRTHMGYGFLEQLKEYKIKVPDLVTIESHGNELYRDFHLAIGKEQFKKWQLTGKTIPVEVTASLPRYWGAGVYQNNTDSKWQKICFLTCGAVLGEQKVFQVNKELHIPQVPQDLMITKKDKDTGEGVKGAGFSLWAYDGNGYTKKAGEFQDLQDGRYLITGVRYTDTTDGRFLVREDRAPAGYRKTYVFENDEDRAQYEQYGGREIVMGSGGFSSPTVSLPLEFREEKEKEEPEERSITIYKKIRAEEIHWEHGNPTFFFKIEGVTGKGEKKIFHRYITFTSEQVKTKDGWVTGMTRVDHLQPGIYQVDELNQTMRYILTNAESEDPNVGVTKTKKEYINGFGKILAKVEMDLSNRDGSVCYENRKIRYDDYSHNSVKENHIRVGK